MSPTRQEPRVATAVRLPQTLHRRLHHAAVERTVSANLLVTRAIEEYLDRLPGVASSVHTTDLPVADPEVTSR